MVASTRSSLRMGMVLVVKRIKDWALSSNDFKQRMERLYQAKHPNVLPALAFYCSKLREASGL
ncbi:hypothetical protein GBA52_028791 [Prunus armeniaca]|nr:hypothetical protein GBA52_028791 [Prunus armeniaca]